MNALKKVFALLFGFFVVLTCTDQQHQQTEAELSAFGEYVYALDTAQLESHFQQLLRADTSHWKADRVVRQHYAASSPLDVACWFSRMGVSADADSLLAHLRRQIPRCGLDTAAFFLPQIAADLEIVHRLAFDSLGVSINEVLPRLELMLSRAYMRYTTGQRYGFLRPDRLFNQLDVKVQGEGFARLFDDAVKAPDYEAAMRHMTSETRIDYLLASQPEDPVYQALCDCLSTTTDPAKRHTLAINIERCRWQMPRLDTSGRHIIVNLAAQHLWAVRPDSVLDMRICCGAIPTKTPLLHSAITHMQVNPDWIIPQNIVKAEVVRHAGDSAYFARNHYYIVNRSSGDTLRPATVTVAQMQSGRLRIGQHGGAGNSLGRIIFRFPNSFAVYLHDTNNRGAFKRERRTLSHGCVRVQKPLELARFLLPEADEWTLDRLRISMDLAPESARGQDYLKEHKTDPRPLRLISHQNVTPHVPLAITYFTAFPTPGTHQVDFYPDIYGYDHVIEQEIKSFIQ